MFSGIKKTAVTVVTESEWGGARARPYGPKVMLSKHPHNLPVFFWPIPQLGTCPEYFWSTSFTSGGIIRKNVLVLLSAICLKESLPLWKISLPFPLKYLWKDPCNGHEGETGLRLSFLPINNYKIGRNEGNNFFSQWTTGSTVWWFQKRQINEISSTII